MAYSRLSRGKRDAIEGDIIKALREAGCEVFQISGRRAPDLLAWCGRPYVMEVKSGKGKATNSQQGAPWPVVRSIPEALAVINASGEPSGIRYGLGGGS